MVKECDRNEEQQKKGCGKDRWRDMTSTKERH